MPQPVNCRITTRPRGGCTIDRSRRCHDGLTLLKTGFKNGSRVETLVGVFEGRTAPQ